MKRVVKVFCRENTTIDVLFDDGVVKRYDVLLLADIYPQLNMLKDRKLFLKARVCGYSGIAWNDELDIEGDTIYSDGKTVDIDEPTILYILGFKIKMMRLKKELSQQELAKLSNIDQGDISKIESGIANPTVLTINKLFNILSSDNSFKHFENVLDSSYNQKIANNNK